MVSRRRLCPCAAAGCAQDINQHLKKIYGTEVSAEWISRVTDSVSQMLEEWRNRELEKVYPILFLDAIVVKIRDNVHVVMKSIHLALAIALEGRKELLGLWWFSPRRSEE